ncbi:hypothetical protein PV332_14675 [Streptomyces scabiei]|uniref:DUF6919 domain-containing protein n=1 Tax=Streptomyces scabiei TaxID=1930 RepID=UPI0029BCEF1F|nr:hypothetical protein [Streptomyces scabiei]MDX2576715.1 hypothetical protein [Streptomyces scabiei]MDX3029672.1 hypothetical protein [Streptomyces scabiei]MDX3204912.1 hypothetical protein [Streptomyces scabiei]
MRRILPGCDRQAVREVAAAWQVTLIDPVWGRNTVLWPLLGRFLDSWAHGGLDEGDEQR